MRYKKIFIFKGEKVFCDSETITFFDDWDNQITVSSQEELDALGYGVARKSLDYYLKLGYRVYNIQGEYFRRYQDVLKKKLKLDFFLFSPNVLMVRDAKVTS